MSKKDKLISRFSQLPSDFHFDELVTLLSYYNFEEVKKGKTSGSRVKFMNPKGIPIYLHKPHPTGILKRYQLKQVKDLLKL